MMKYSIFLSFLLSLLVSGCAINSLTTDKDQDGVADSIDICKNTPKLAIVDKFGCAADSDHDGVVDLYDKCPKTPFLKIVNSKGCPVN